MKLQEKYALRLTNLSKIVKDNFSGNWSELATKLGKQQSYISELKNGKRKFTEDLVEEIEEKLNLFGVLDVNDEAINDDIFADKMRIPRYGLKASAGEGEIIVAENIIGYALLDYQILTKFNSKQENLAVVKVSGKSMMPTLFEGEEILVDLSKREKIDNRLFLLTTRNELWVKRMRITPVGSFWESDNEEYRKYDDMYNDDKTTVRIVGLVLRSLGRDVF
jgi:phage repressor protein C with HTH and peptisase S24 domain